MKQAHVKRGERGCSSVVRALASNGNGPSSIPGLGIVHLWILCVTKWGNAASFGWDVKPRSSLCSTPNMDYKNPDVTEEENMWFVTPCKHLEKRDTWAPGSTPRTLFQSRDLEQYNIKKNTKQKKIWTNEPYVLPTVKNIWVWAALFWF